MSLSKPSITGKWDRLEWKRLYTTAAHKEESKTERIEKKREKEKYRQEKGRRILGRETATTAKTFSNLSQKLTLSRVFGCVSVEYIRKCRIYMFRGKKIQNHFHLRENQIKNHNLWWFLNLSQIITSEIKCHIKYLMNVCLKLNRRLKYCYLHISNFTNKNSHVALSGKNCLKILCYLPRILCTC